MNPFLVPLCCQKANFPNRKILHSSTLAFLGQDEHIHTWFRVRYPAVPIQELMQRVKDLWQLKTTRIQEQVPKDQRLYSCQTKQNLCNPSQLQNVWSTPETLWLIHFHFLSFFFLIRLVWCNLSFSESMSPQCQNRNFWRHPPNPQASSAVELLCLTSEVDGLQVLDKEPTKTCWYFVSGNTDPRLRFTAVAHNGLKEKRVLGPSSDPFVPEQGHGTTQQSLLAQKAALWNSWQHRANLKSIWANEKAEENFNLCAKWISSVVICQIKVTDDLPVKQATRTVTSPFTHPRDSTSTCHAHCCSILPSHSPHTAERLVTTLPKAKPLLYQPLSNQPTLHPPRNDPHGQLYKKLLSITDILPCTQIYLVQSKSRHFRAVVMNSCSWVFSVVCEPYSLITC